jgi:hypothetical protein
MWRFFKWRTASSVGRRAFNPVPHKSGHGMPCPAFLAFLAFPASLAFFCLLPTAYCLLFYFSLTLLHIS